MKIEIKAIELDLEALGLMIDALNKWYGCIKIEMATAKEENQTTITNIIIERE